MIWHRCSNTATLHIESEVLLALECVCVGVDGRSEVRSLEFALVKLRVPYL